MTEILSFTLTELNEGDHTQLYYRAQNVQKLDIHGEECKLHKNFKDINFRCLEHISIDASEENKPDLLEPYLQPQLEVFHFYGGYLSDAFLEKLVERCPKLRDILIDNPRDSITAQGFLQFLEKAQTLKKLTILFGFENIISNEVLTKVATRPNLVSLAIGKPINSQIITASESTTLFPQLRELSCTAEASSFLSLSRHLSMLTTLRITLVGTYDQTTRFLLSLSATCSKLQSLEVVYNTPDATTLHPDELTALARALPDLKRLCLSGDSVHAPDLSNSHLAETIQQMRGLKVLRIGLKCQLTEAAFDEVGKVHGETLEQCELWVKYDISRLDRIEGLFSVLKELTVEGLEDTVNATSDKAVEILEKSIPRLEILNVNGDRPFEQAVEKAWREHRN